MSLERARRWTRGEYDRLISLGIFRPGEHLELLGGHLIVSEPQGSFQSAAVGLVDEALGACLGPGWAVRVQMPIALDDESEPEPDVAVVMGTHRDYAAAHPTRAALLVEVADSSLPDDRGTKAALYARAGIADYWILNLIDRVLECAAIRSPRPFSLPAGTIVRSRSCAPAPRSPLCHGPDARVEVAAILPPSGYDVR
jgi:Uma2 family endonuclease